MIKENSIEQVKTATNIVDVIIDCGISLRKKGSNYVSQCPFHPEKSASFSVDQSKQIYKCFGCGEAGDAIKFLQKQKGFQFHEAIEWLASKYHINLEYDGTQISQEAKDEKTRALELMGKVKRQYHNILMQTPEAVKYMTDRGFTTETLALWEIGLAPESWTTVKEIAIKESQWDLAVKCGLCVENGDKNRDFFYNRIIIPICDEKGNCISFGGRIWTDAQEQKKEPKYLNGPESFLYDKGKVIFGMHRAMSAINKKQEAILVEGYFDVIMSHQNEITNVVATCGTGVTETHAKMIVKRAKSVLFAGDSDAAGEKSILKSIDLFLEAGAMQLNVIEWPEGVKDIDQFLKQAN
jgi:DNA primase